MRLDEIERTENEIEKVKDVITNFQYHFMDGNISPNDFHPMRQKTE
jgi:hypothetical protein